MRSSIKSSALDNSELASTEPLSLEILEESVVQIDISIDSEVRTNLQHPQDLKSTNNHKIIENGKPSRRSQPRTNRVEREGINKKPIPAGEVLPVDQRFVMGDASR